MYKAGILINGKEMPARGGETFPVVAPESGSVVGEAALGNADDIDRAVTAARGGFEEWSRLDPKDRERVLLRAAEIFEADGVARLLDLLIDESGSTIGKAGYEIGYTPDLFRAAAGEVRRLYGDTFPNDRNDRLSIVVREPVGVVGILSPCNAPLALLAKMAAFPLAAGNSVVVKPSEETPLIAIEFAKILLEAGLPAGAINVVPGFGRDCGSALVAHPDVDAIALTGATATGKAIGAAAMQTVKRVQFELGGKNALVIRKDFDPAKAAEIAIGGIFFHAGQICMANSRVIVEEPVYADFLMEFKQQVARLHLGDLRNPRTVYGPLINRTAVEKVQLHQKEALEAGAKLLTGGKVINGLVYAPTALTNTPRDSAAWRSESFGPIVNIVSAVDFDESVELANDSDYGLSAGILTHDIAKAMLAARRIRAGSVHIGMHPFQSNAMAPIGGYKESGLGRSGGKYSTEEFTELKWISMETGTP